jgi:large conductance mechanosensitive channel
MLKEFRDFIAKGNVMDMAVGIVIGAAFTAIVNSLVKDLLTPLIGSVGKANFENLFVVLKEGTTPGPYATPDIAQKTGAVTLTYGNFLNAVINFLIVAFALFLLIKAVNRLRRPTPVAVVSTPEPSAEEKLLTEIRDLLKAGK